MSRQAELVVQVADVLDLAGVDVVGQLRARVGLEGVRRVVRLQTGLQEVLRRGAGATGDRAVDELEVGLLLVEDSDESVEADLLGACGPPGEDLHLARAGAAGAVTGRVVTTGVTTACCEAQEGNRAHECPNGAQSGTHENLLSLTALSETTRT